MSGGHVMQGSLRIGEVARLRGVSTKTIRHYQRVGLIGEPQRATAGYRLYSADDLARLARIRRLQRLGRSLAQVRSVLGGPDQERTLREVLEAPLASCDEQMRALQARRTRIEQGETMQVIAPGTRIADLLGQRPE